MIAQFVATYSWAKNIALDLHLPDLKERMDTVCHHESSEDQSRDHLKVGNLPNIKEDPQLFVPTEKNHSSDNQEEETGHLQEELMEGS
jgi:hypothetical protein